MVAAFQSLGVLRGLSRKGLTGLMSAPVNVPCCDMFFLLTRRQVSFIKSLSKFCLSRLEVVELAQHA